ncbi:hypothetical protein HC766_02665 [Candidatus Gracilibacteria bacterium]|nr:hypothetical protein [Candidatus Gracilibacteria bacterium]
MFGNLLAQRCSIDEKVTKVICVAKQRKVIFTSPEVRDVIFEIDITTNNLTFPYPNLVLSAKSIHLSNSGEVFVIAQNNSKLYKIQ